MTTSQDARLRSWREGAQALAAVVTIVLALIAGFVWFTGGFRPESQVQIARLTDQVAQLSSAITDLTHKVEQMPRASDYAIHETHLQQLDKEFGGLADRVHDDELNARDVSQQIKLQAQQIQRLNDGTDARTRQPR